MKVVSEPPGGRPLPESIVIRFVNDHPGTLPVAGSGAGPDDACVCAAAGIARARHTSNGLISSITPPEVRRARPASSPTAPLLSPTFRLLRGLLPSVFCLPRGAIA